RCGDDANERTHVQNTDGLLVRGADGAPVTQFTVVDAEIESALWVATRPGLVGDRRAITTIVAQGKQNPGLALSAGGQLHRLVHIPNPPSSTTSADPCITARETPRKDAQVTPSARRTTDTRARTHDRNRRPRRILRACRWVGSSATPSRRG